MFAVSDFVRQRDEVSHDAKPGKQHEEIIGNINLPPVEASLGGYWIMVMIVVPALTHCQDGSPDVIAAVIRHVVPARTEHMIDGVDRKCGMAAHNGGNKKPPDEELRTAGVKVRPIQEKYMPNEQDDCGFHNENRIGLYFREKLTQDT